MTHPSTSPSSTVPTPAAVFYESARFILFQDSPGPHDGIPQVRIQDLALSPHGWDKPATVTLTGDDATALLAQVERAIVEHYDPQDVEASEERGMTHIDRKILAPLDEKLRNGLEAARLAEVKDVARSWIEDGVRQNLVAFIDAVDHMFGQSYPVYTFLPAVDEDVVRAYMGDALRRYDDRPPLTVEQVRIVPLATVSQPGGSAGDPAEPLTWARLIATREQVAYRDQEEAEDGRIELAMASGARGYNLWGAFDVIAQAAGVTVRNGVFDAFDAMGLSGATVFSVQPANDGMFELLLHKNGQAHTSPCTYSSESYAVKTALDFERKFVTPHAHYHNGGGRRDTYEVLPVEDLVKAWSVKAPDQVSTQPGQRPGTTPGTTPGMEAVVPPTHRAPYRR